VTVAAKLGRFIQPVTVVVCLQLGMIDCLLVSLQIEPLHISFPAVGVYIPNAGPDSLISPC